MPGRYDKDQVPNIRRLELQVADIFDSLNRAGGVYATINAQGQTIYSLLNTRVNTPASPVANLLWNGEIGHSVYTWHDTLTTTPPRPANGNREAAWWYSHQTPASAQSFAVGDIGTNVVTIPGHGFTTACAVDWLAATTKPTNISLLTTYFIIVIDPNTVSLATTMANAFAGTAVAFTSAGAAGTQTIQPILVATYTSTTAGTDLNQELKTTAQTASYFPQFARWDSTNGWAEMTGTTTVDQPLPMNFVDATVNLARVSLIAARKNSFIEIPDEAKMAVGIFDNTSGERQFLQGSIGLQASFNGIPDPAGDRRDFRVLLTSDRGYQLLSEIVSVYNTPATLDATHNITLAWAQQAGQLQVDIIEYDPSGTPEYRLIAQVSAATSFIYQGAYLRLLPDGWPSATGTVLDATYFTQTADMADLATNGVSGFWDTVNFPIEVPNNYDKGVTTDRQWLRVWMTQAPNLFITDAVTDGTGLVAIPDGAVNTADFASGGYCGTGVGPWTIPYSSGAATESLYVDLVVQVYDVDDALLATTSIDTVTSNTSITLAANVAAGASRKIRIVGAGFHGILIDKVHLGFQQNTSYAPNALDVRSLQPLAAPSSSTQGGVGGGGSGGGIIRCVAKGTPIKMHVGIWKPVETTRVGQLWAAAGLQPNTLIKIKPSYALVRKVTAENGVWIYCTDTEKFMVDGLDTDGTKLMALRVGDTVVTEIDGAIEITRIAEISAHVGRMEVYSPTVSHSKLFVAGQIERTWWQVVRDRLLARWIKPRVGGFVLHNKEQDPDGGGPI